MIISSLRLKSRFPLFLVAFLLFLQIFSPSRSTSFVLVLLVGVLLVAWLWARELSRRVLLQRMRRYGWAQVGDVIEERFVMHNDSWLPVLWAELRDHSDLPGYTASRAIGLPPRHTSRWTTEGVAERRGIYTLGPLEITMGDPFGLFEVKLKHNYSETFVVYPPIAALPPILEPRGLARGMARTNIRSLDLTTNAASVRHYVPGDALNRIHWRSTARRSTPDREEIFVKEYDLEPSGDLWIVLDMNRQAQAGEGLDSTEEYAVILAASLANQMLRENHAVGLATFDGEMQIVPPTKGPNQLWEILRLLAGVHARSETSLGQLLTLLEPVTGRNMTAALITPSADPEWIEGVAAFLRRGVHLTGLLVDSTAFGGHAQMAGMLGALADLGVLAHIVGKDFDFERISQRRRQRPEYRALGTGRVVVVNRGDEEAARWVSVGQGTGES